MLTWLYRAFILVLLLVGPEMTQEERAEEAEQAQEYERLREQGASLKDIGIARAKGVDVGADAATGENNEKDEVERKERAGV